MPTRLWVTDAAQPDCGRIEFAVECTAGASPSFAGRGGDALAHDIASALRRMTSYEGAIDRRALHIIPGRVWVLFVDVVVLQCAGGNLHDAVALAVRAALQTTRIPDVQVVTDADTGEPIDFEFSNDPHAVHPVAGVGASMAAAVVCVCVCVWGGMIMAPEHACRRQAILPTNNLSQNYHDHAGSPPQPVTSPQAENVPILVTVGVTKQGSTSIIDASLGESYLVLLSRETQKI